MKKGRWRKGSEGREEMRERVVMRYVSFGDSNLLPSVWAQVYSFGNGSGVGKGTTEPRQYTPWMVEALEGEMIIDISTGDGHCLALTQSEEHVDVCILLHVLVFFHFASCSMCPNFSWLISSSLFLFSFFHIIFSLPHPSPPPFSLPPSLSSPPSLPPSLPLSPHFPPSLFSLPSLPLLISLPPSLPPSLPHRRRGVCVGYQQYGTVWSGTQQWLHYYTLEGEGSGRCAGTTDLCWHISQYRLDCSACGQVCVCVCRGGSGGWERGRGKFVSSGL